MLDLTGSTRCISGPRRKTSGRSGFTLLEVMMVTFISSFVFAGVLSAYIFLGRGLARQVNEESLESRSRLALYWFTQDVSTASGIAACVPSSPTSGKYTWFTLTTSSGGTVSYYTDWTAGDAGIRSPLCA